MQIPSLIKIISYAGRTNVTYSATFSIQRRCSSLMKAVLLHEYGPPKLLKVQDVPLPKPDKSEVLVKVHAAGVNPVDCLIREGAFMTLPELPIILGKEVAGVIQDIGPSVTSHKVGDRVTCCLPRNGGYAQYVTCEEKYLIPLSEKLTFPQGAALYVSYFIAYRALLTKCKIKKGETLLIHGGSGGVGIAAIQIGKSRGLTVFGTASSEEGLKAMTAAGADHVYNHKYVKHLEGQDYILKIASSVNIRGFDVIIENCAEENLAKDLTILSKNGRIAVIGAGASQRHLPGRKPHKLISVNPRSLIYTEGAVHGINLTALTEVEFQETREEILRGVEADWLRPIINKEFPLAQAGQAHKLLFSETGAQGKIVLSVTS